VHNGDTSAATRVNRLPPPGTGPYTTGNRVLDALPALDRYDLAADLAVVGIAAHTTTHAFGDRIDHVDFPIDAVLSVIATLENGDSIEVGTIGCESFAESDLALDAPTSQRTSFCQVQGTIARMPVARFQARMHDSAAFARAMRLNVRAGLFSAQQYAACNVRHSILQRCARWLAMTEDRVGRPDFTLTHEFLSIMLGVRRASVSEAADQLSTMGAISYRRGAITVRDHTLLRSTACECYDVCKSAFESSLQP
jgi:CRP-like cAMP-binding protein